MNTTAKTNLRALLPVLFSFFVMGFIDIVGTATSNIKADLNLSNTLAGLLPNFILIWFLILSVPFGLLAGRVGRKASVQVSNVITLIAMLIPLPLLMGWMEANLTLYLVTFALLGIGNTMIQVTLNPLLTNISAPDKLARNMTLGQFAKALCSLSGPQLVLFAIVSLGNWNYIFLIYAALTLLSMLWLSVAPIEREQPSASGNSTFGSVFSLLKDKFIRSIFCSILLIVGIDVGLNFFIPVIFKEVFEVEYASGVNTLYFAARALGAVVCALLLVRYSPKRILLWTMIVAMAAYGGMMWLASLGTAAFGVQVLFCLLFLPMGFATGNVFAIVFSFALRHLPAQADAISSLLIMGVAGGGAITFAMGLISDYAGILGGMSVLLVCMVYILVVAIRIMKNKEIA